MSDAVTVATIGAVGLILSGVLVELVRTRRRADSAAERATTAAAQGAEVARQVVPNGGASLRDAVDRIEAGLSKVREDQGRHGERLAAVEARLDERNRRAGGGS
jgi:hypothetical protein